MSVKALLIILAMTVIYYESIQGPALTPPFKIVEHDKHSWLQPQSVSHAYSSPINKSYWQFDFEHLEKTLQASYLNSSNLDLSNQGTLNLLKNIVSQLPANLSNRDLSRIQFLVLKTLTGISGQEFASLLKKYYAYHYALTDYNRSKYKGENLIESRFQLQEIHVLQQHHFGKETAASLFGASHALSNYLLSRREINTNPVLNQQQKNKRLEELKRNFKIRLLSNDNTGYQRIIGDVK